MLVCVACLCACGPENRLPRGVSWDKPSGTFRWAMGRSGCRRGFTGIMVAWIHFRADSSRSMNHS